MAQPPPPIDVTDPVAPAIAAGVGLGVGDHVDERYRLEGRIGRGGGGTVWRAFDEKLEEPVALKIVAKHGDTERWRREVALARRISHPNVCRVFDLGESGELRWVTMELVLGESLRHALPDLNSERARSVGDQIVAGAAAIHAAGIIHRDLKPENIILADDGRAVIVDFGLAREPTAQSPVTHEGAVLGTPGYMAPEQALGQSVDERTDVYALGLVLHEVATGTLPRPFGITKPARPSRMQKQDSRRAMPPLWAQVIDRCIAVDPDERFNSAIEVAGALRAPTKQRRLALWGSLGAVGLLALVALVAVVAAGSRSEQSTVDAGPAGVARAHGELRERRLTFSEPSAQPLSVALSKDGKVVAFTVANQLYRRAMGDKVATPMAMPQTKAGNALARYALAVGFFPNQDVAVWIRHRDRRFQLWRVGTGKPTLVYENKAPFRAALSPNGNQFALSVGATNLLVLLATGGEPREVVASGLEQRISAFAWGPGGERLAFVRSRPDGTTSVELVTANGGQAKVIYDQPLGIEDVNVVSWPRAGSLLVATTEHPNAGALWLLDTTGRAAARSIARWPGEAVIAADGSATQLAVVRGSRRPRVYVGSLSKKHGYISLLKPAHPDATSAVRLAGWTDDGRVVYSSSSGSSYDIVAATISGEGEVIADGPSDLFADTLDDVSVIYQQSAGDSVEVWRRELGGKGNRVAQLAPRRDRSATRCSGDKRPPCVVERRDRDAHYHVVNLSNGELGSELLSTAMADRGDFAVSSDGKRLAIVDGSPQLRIVDLAGGKAEILEARGGYLTTVSWSGDDKSLVVSADHYKDRFNLLRIGLDGKVRVLEHSNHQHYQRARESRDGEDIAVETVDDSAELWIVDGY